MDQVLDHLIISSFKEFLSYKILSDLNAFQNKTVQLFNTVPARKIVGKQVYGSSYAQWLYDSSIIGANIPSGLSGISRGTSGLSIDYKNGRIFVNSGTPVDNTIDVSVPDFNIYIATESVQKILLESKYNYRPDLLAASAAVPADSIIAPCIFLSYQNSTNETWALGGINQSVFSMQVAVFSDNIHHLFAIQQVIRDIETDVFPILPYTPLNELNDLKYSYWNYKILLDNITDPNTFVYIEDTTFRILDLDFVNQAHPGLFVGLGNVKLGKFRTSESDIFDYPYIYIDEDQQDFFSFQDNLLAEVQDD